MTLKPIAIAAFVFLPACLFAQDSTGSISGTIQGPQGEYVPYMWVRANDKDSAEHDRDESSLDGNYRLTGLPPGSYTLEINVPCCAYVSYVSDEIVVGAGEAVEFEVHLLEGTSFNTVGDDPGVISSAIRSQAVIPDEPLPKFADGTPDLSGIWLLGNDPFPEAADAQDWAQALWDERIANEFADHPHVRCLPGDAPIAGGAAPFIAKFVHKLDLLILLMEDAPGFRQVFMDGRDHPEYPNPSWMGHSVGHWEGDTLVIDTVGFNDRGWMSFYPRSESLHITERYTRTEYGYMEMELTIDDPEVFNKPWVLNIPLYLAPQAELIEYVCENNKWAPGPGD